MGVDKGERTPLPMEFDSDDVIYSFPCNTVNFSLAPSALALNTLTLSLRHLKFSKLSTFCRQCATFAKKFRLLTLTRKKQH